MITRTFTVTVLGYEEEISDLDLAQQSLVLRIGKKGNNYTIVKNRFGAFDEKIPVEVVHKLLGRLFHPDNGTAVAGPMSAEQSGAKDAAAIESMLPSENLYPVIQE